MATMTARTTNALVRVSPRKARSAPTVRVLMSRRVCFGPVDGSSIVLGGR